MIEALSLGTATALASVCAAAPLRAIAIRRGYVDVPGGRKEHAVTTPLLGGVAIYGSMLVLAFPYALAYEYRLVCLALAGAAVMFAVGLLDDLAGASVTMRLAAQFAASGLLAFSGLRLNLVQAPLPDTLLTVAFIVTATNALNLLDNMDGLAAGLAAAAAAAFLAIAALQADREAALLAGAVAGASLGFLPYNFPRARMFMGDAGSLPLGFLLSVMSLMLGQGEPAVRRFVPLMALALPLADTGLVIASRLKRGVNPLTTPGSDHLSHRLARLLGTRRRAVLACWAVGWLTSIVTVILLT